MKELLELFRGQQDKSLYQRIENKLKSRRLLISTPEILWPNRNSSLYSYERDFRGVLYGEQLIDLVKDRNSPVVIDVMAPSGTLARLFQNLPQSDKLGIAITKKDLRWSKTKKRDEQLGIVQINGDLANIETWRNISRALKGRKADLIVERGFGGLLNLPRSTSFYELSLQMFWSMLSNDDGIMILQVYEKRLKSLGISVEQWVDILKLHNIAADFSSVQNSSGFGSLRLERQMILLEGYQICNKQYLLCG